MNPILETKQIAIGNVVIGGDAPIALITGPCQLETRDHTMFMAEAKGPHRAGSANLPPFWPARPVRLGCQHCLLRHTKIQIMPHRTAPI